MFVEKKNPHRSGPMPFKSMLCKGQLYVQVIQERKMVKISRQKE